MKRCPITYQLIEEAQSYSQAGLKQLAPNLKDLQPLKYTTAELREEAVIKAGKMSIQGVQLKLSATLNIKKASLEIVDQSGAYILKPQSEYYTELPENEAITMTLASSIGLEVPVHGLLYAIDGRMTYFIKRFDRINQGQRLPVEDFSQLLNHSRDTKYSSSMEQVAKVIKTFCSFPAIELVKLFKLTLFNFLIGNEDMHLKNFSLITRGNITTISPVYDLLNTSIAMKNPLEEIALPLNGKKRNLSHKDFLKYFAEEKLTLHEKTIHSILQQFKNAIPTWINLINVSFLSSSAKQAYLKLLLNRCQRLELDITSD